MHDASSERPLPHGDEGSGERIAGIVDRHRGTRGALIATLEEIQAEHGYLPEAALRAVAEGTGRSLVDVYGVATFYNLFNMKPRGKHLVSVCLGTACHVRGSRAVVEEFERQLGIRVGDTTPDKCFTLKTVNCLGACALGPVAVIDGRYFSKLRRSRVSDLIEAARNDLVSAGNDAGMFPVKVSCPSCNHSLMDPAYQIGDRPSIKLTASFGHQHGWLRLSSIYGKYDVFSEHEIPPETVLNFFCPHCHARMIGSWECSKCGAPMVQMMIRGGGTVRICSRSGCSGSDSHMLDLA